ncbi:hypothetical protein D3C80_1493610 [compost metagenome]
MFSQTKVLRFMTKTSICIMNPNTQIRHIIRMKVGNRKVINCNWFIQFNELNLINRKVDSISFLEFIPHLKFIRISKFLN